jgi:predicted peptidase
MIESILRSASICALAFISLSSALADVQEKSGTFNGLTVRYKVVLPPNYDPAKAYPAVLAFPPGGQEMDLVNATLAGNYRNEAEKRGYIVIEPSAPNGTLFFEGGERIFPAFITKMLADYKIAGNKFNAAGNSNGGLSAFLIASTYPQYFWSVTGFPGFLDEATPQRLAALKGLCIHMFVGGSDSGWPEEMRDQSTKLKANGYNVTFNVEPGQPHVIRTLTGAGAARLYNQFDQARAGHCAPQN